MTTATLEHTTTEQQTENQDLSEFRIDNDQAANWYLRRLANLQAERDRIQQQAETILKQLDSDAASLRYLYEEELKAYVRRKLTAGKRGRKSVHFLQGSAGFRTMPASLKIADGKAAQEYAESEFPAAIKTMQTLDLSAYKERAEWLYKETGELLPGVDLQPEHESFSIRFGPSE